MRRAALAGLVLLGLALATWPALLRGGALLPLDWPYECCEPWRSLAPDTRAANPRQNDAINQLLPLDLYTRERLRRFEVPLWNPWLGAGIPHLATGFSRALYPPFWLTLPLDPVPARTLEVLLHVVLAGLLQLAWLRRLGCGWPAGLLGGIAFASSGALAVRLQLGYVHQTLVWLPGLLWGVEGALRGRRAASAGLAAIAALQLLAGSLPDVFASWLFVSVYACGRAAAGAARRGGGVARAGARLALAVAVAALVAGAQLAPHFELVGLSQRGERALAELKATATPPAALLTLLSPSLFGTDAGRDYALPVPSPGVQLFVGAVALAGVLFFLRGRRARRALPIAIATGVVLLVAAGTPLLDLLAGLLPPLLGLRYVYTFSNVSAAGFAALGALGLDRLLRSRGAALGAGPRALLALLGSAATLAAAGFVADPVRARALGEAGVGIAALALVLGLAHARQAAWLGRGALAAALIVISGLDLGRFAAHENPVVDPVRFPLWPASEPLAAIAADPAAPRVLSVTRGEQPWPPGPNTLYGWGLRDAGAYHSLLPQRLVRYFTVMNRRFEGAAADQALAGGRPLFNALEAYAFRPDPLARLLRVGYLVRASDAPPEIRERLVRSYRGELRIYRYLDVLPRGFVAPRFERVADGEQALVGMLAPGFDPLELALVEGELREPERREGDGAERVEVLEDAPERLRLEVESDGGMLVVCDAAYPGWTARVDGARVPLLVADQLFRGVVVDAGVHRVELAYQPDSWRFGRWASGLGLLLLAALAGLGLARGSVPAGARSKGESR